MTYFHWLRLAGLRCMVGLWDDIRMEVFFGLRSETFRVNEAFV